MKTKWIWISLLAGCAGQVERNDASEKCYAAQVMIDRAYNWCEKYLEHSPDCSSVESFSIEDFSGCEKALKTIDCNVLYFTKENDPNYPAECRTTFIVK